MNCRKRGEGNRKPDSRADEMKQNMYKCIGAGLTGIFVFLTGCAVIGTHRFYLEGETPQTGKLAVRNITVTIDRANDADIAWQVQQTMLAKLTLNPLFTVRSSEPAYALDVSMTQHSYIEGLEIKNSIYASITILDREERPVALGLYYEAGKRSLVSAKVQDYVTKRLINGLLNQLKTKKAAAVPEIE
jgi:hypothetical protein